ncbi:MAG: hypothetical protein FJ117_18135 [Deltaproteobacteria bacterium]|nr:hypothetical protein [Deltaproteobacteria bacterium]
MKNLSNPSGTSGYDRNIGGTNPGKDSVLAGGPGRYAPEASAGISLFMVYSLNLRRRRRPIHGEISASCCQVKRPEPWFWEGSSGIS